MPTQNNLNIEIKPLDTSAKLPEDKDGKGDLLNNPYTNNDVSKIESADEQSKKNWSASDGVNLVKKIIDNLTFDVYLGKFGLKSLIAIVVVALFLLGKYLKLF